jgi:hypothetical protein
VQQCSKTCMLHKPMVRVNIPAFARTTAFVLLLSLTYASKYCPKYHVSVYLLLAADYHVETYLRSCNITRIFAFSGIRLPNNLILHTHTTAKMADEFQQIEAPVTVKVSYLVLEVMGSANKHSRRPA